MSTMKKQALTLPEIVIILVSLAVVIVLGILASYSFVNTVDSNRLTETESRILASAVRQFN